MLISFIDEHCGSKSRDWGYVPMLKYVCEIIEPPFYLF